MPRTELVLAPQGPPAAATIWERLAPDERRLRTVAAAHADALAPGPDVEQIARGAWDFFTRPGADPDWSELDRATVTVNLTRTLRYGAGAPSIEDEDTTLKSGVVRKLGHRAKDAR